MKTISKALITVTALLTMMFAFSSVCFAMDNGESSFVGNDGKTYTVRVSNELTPYGDPAVDKVPHALGIIPRSAVVTASDVQRYVMTTDPDYAGEYYARGYVTMQDGGVDAWHYSLAQMWWQGSLDKTGQKMWDYGTAWAESYTSFNPGTARIFYGIS